MRNKTPLAKIEFKSASPLEFKADITEGIISGYASTWERDEGGDRIEKGAYAQVIENDLPRNRIKIYREHDVPIGLPQDLREDDTGLWIEAKVVPGDTVDGDETLRLADSKVYDAFSIGWVGDPSAMRFAKEGGLRTRVISNIIRLPHVGILDDPMNTGALVQGVKSEGVDLSEIKVLLETIQEGAAGIKGLADQLRDVQRILESPKQQPLPLARAIKSFWDLVSAFDAMDTLESIRQWGSLSDEDAAAAIAFIEELREVADAAEKKLPVDETNAVLRQFVETVRSRAA